MPLDRRLLRQPFYGSFLLLGPPPGVGKTELCKVANFLFDSEEHLIRIGMRHHQGGVHGRGDEV